MIIIYSLLNRAFQARIISKCYSSSSSMYYVSYSLQLNNLLGEWTDACSSLLYELLRATEQVKLRSFTRMYAYVKEIEIDHFYNDVDSLEILPGTSLASMSCGFKSQKRALLSVTHEIVLSVNLEDNDAM